MGDARLGLSLATSGRSFVRSLNLLLKSARLYSLGHPRTLEQLKTAWQELRAAVEAEGTFTVSVAGERLLLNSAPIEPSPAERTFIRMLSQARLTSLQFSPTVRFDDFRHFVELFAESSQASERLARLGEELEAAGLTTIRLNTVRYVAQDPALGESMAENELASELVSQTLGSQASQLRDWLKDPQKLIQLIAAAQGAQSPPLSTAAADVPASEADVLGAFRWLGQLARTSASRPEEPGVSAAAPPTELETLAPAQAARLQQALAELPTGASSPDLLVKLAEHLAIRYALAQFESGQTQVHAVRQVIDRMAKEISSLRGVLSAHEEKMRKAGLAPESYADALDRQFWASVPAAAKLEVLLSPDAWCIPARNIQSFLEELFERQQEQEAFAVLLNYARCVGQADREARRKAALGVSELASLMARGGEKLLQAASEHLARQLHAETDPDVQGLLVHALGQLAAQAVAQSHYPVVVRSLQAAETLERAQPALARNLRSGLLTPAQVRTLFRTALQSPAAELLQLLGQLPGITAELLVEHFRNSERVSERERLAELAAGLGAEVCGQLVQQFLDGPPPRAVEAVGLLSRLAPGLLEQHLATRIGQWDRMTQDRAVRAIAAGGASGRGWLLKALAEHVHPYVLPVVLDEVGLAGDLETVPWLLRLASGESALGAEPYFRIKAIEALGRIHDCSAVPVLTQLVEAKQVWRWAHPHEIRVCAAQALQQLDPEHAQKVLRRAGLSERELSVAPLDPTASSAWTRQRRYPRVPLAEPIPAVLSWLQGSVRAHANILSLGGGHVKMGEKISAGTAVDMELATGLRHIEGTALVRRVDVQGVGFEFVDFNPENRARLRQLLLRLRSAA